MGCGPMSFRRFVYWCAMCGGCAAYVGWLLGLLALVNDSVLQAAFKGMFLGMALALALGLIDALWNFSASQLGQVITRVLTAQFVGGVGGFLGGMIGQLLYGRLQARAGQGFSLALIFAWVFLILGWTFTGLLIGASVSTFDLFARMLREEEIGGVKRKLMNGVLGGAAGGLLGGFFFLVLQGGWSLVLHSKASDFWSPGATGFV